MKLLNLLQTTEMADVMPDGKIYVVVAGLVVIALGVLTYLFILDKKVTRIEKEVDGLKKMKHS